MGQSCQLRPVKQKETKEGMGPWTDPAFKDMCLAAPSNLAVTPSVSLSITGEAELDVQSLPTLRGSPLNHCGDQIFNTWALLLYSFLFFPR